MPLRRLHLVKPTPGSFSDAASVLMLSPASKLAASISRRVGRQRPGVGHRANGKRKQRGVPRIHRRVRGSRSSGTAPSVIKLGGG